MAQTEPPSLAGVTLQAVNFPDFQLGEIEVTYSACPPVGDPVTVSFEASGPSPAPYVGTFHEEGTFTFINGVNPGFDQPLIEFASTFTIDSPTGQVTGTKEHQFNNVFDAPFQFGRCFAEFDNDLAVVSREIRYTATIRTAEFVCTDTGIALASVEAIDSGTANRRFFEQFLIDGSTHSCREAPANVTLSPPDAVNDVGTSHTVTATVTDPVGAPVENAVVLFSVSGSSSTGGGCVSDNSGRCSFTYIGPPFPGADVITGCVDSDGSGFVDDGEPCAEATKAWVLPSSTPGQVTGGGHVPNTTGSDSVAFGFSAKTKNGVPQGTCTVVDPSTDTKVKCLDVTALVLSGTHATIFGNAEVNGVTTTYRIDVDDLDEAGGGYDAFRLQTASGYTIGGTLLRGNVQVHS